MNKKPKHFFTILVILIIILSGITYKSNCDKKAKRYYSQGVNLFDEKKYSDAYYNFKQIKPISSLYELSLLKQYQCANNLNDKNTSLIKLKELIKITKNEYIRPWALYKEASLNQEMKKNSDTQLAKKFKYIQDNYPENDFGIASAYKTAQLSNKTTPNEAKESYIKYLSYAPTGKFAQSAIEELSKLNAIFTKEDYEIIANAKLANEQYLSAIEYYQKTTFSKNWHNIAKCYKGLKNKEAEKQIILKGLSLAISDIEEKDISNAIDRLIIINNANKIQLLQELYTKFENSYAFPTIVYKLAESSASVRAIKLYELIANDYPASIWASNALWEVFWHNYKEERYKTCEQIAKKHINQYSKLQDSPRIAYWYARALLKSRKNQQARDIFYDIINDYPLSYYSFLSARQLKISKANKMIVKKSIASYDAKILDKLIFKDKTLLELAEMNDWELIDNFKISDDFIKSWIAYKKQNPTLAINLAKDGLLNDKEKDVITFSDPMLKMIYPIFYEETINHHARVYKQSPYLFLSLIREESHFDKNAKSSVGAMGLSQLMPATANFIEKRPVTKEELTTPEKNIEIGLNYFNYLTQQFNQNEYLAILAYNAGPGNIKKWLANPNIQSSEIDVFVENIPFLETKNYIKKILSSYWVYLNIYSAKNK